MLFFGDPEHGVRGWLVGELGGEVRERDQEIRVDAMLLEPLEDGTVGGAPSPFELQGVEEGGDLVGLDDLVDGGIAGQDQGLFAQGVELGDLRGEVLQDGLGGAAGVDGDGQVGDAFGAKGRADDVVLQPAAVGRAQAEVVLQQGLAGVGVEDPLPGDLGFPEPAEESGEGGRQGAALVGGDPRLVGADDAVNQLLGLRPAWGRWQDEAGPPGGAVPAEVRGIGAGGLAGRIAGVSVAMGLPVGGGPGCAGAFTGVLAVGSSGMRAWLTGVSGRLMGRGGIVEEVALAGVEGRGGARRPGQAVTSGAGRAFRDGWCGGPSGLRGLVGVGCGRRGARGGVGAAPVLGRGGIGLLWTAVGGSADRGLEKSVAASTERAGLGGVAFEPGVDRLGREALEGLIAGRTCRDRGSRSPWGARRAAFPRNL